MFKGAPESFKSFQEAQKFVHTGKYKKAVGKFDELLKQSSEAPWAEAIRFQLAQALRLGHQYPAAIRQLDRFLERYPESPDAPEAFLGKGEIYVQRGMGKSSPMSKMYLDKALRTFKSARKKYPEDETVQAKSWYFLGTTYTAREEYPKAKEAYQTVLQDYAQSSFGVKALYALAGVSLREGDMDEAERLFGDLTDRYPKTRYAGKARKKLAGIGLVGSKAPPVEVKEWIGQPPDVAEGYKGKPVLLSFWAIWCPHCRRNLPTMDQLVRDFSLQGLRIVGITRERENNGIDKIKEYIESHPMLFPTGVDEEGKTSRSFLVSNIPRAVLIDSKGNIAWYGHPDYLTRKVIKDILKGSS